MPPLNPSVRVDVPPPILKVGYADTSRWYDAAPSTAFQFAVKFVEPVAEADVATGTVMPAVVKLTSFPYDVPAALVA